MKKIVLIIVAGLIVVSLMGQGPKRVIPGRESHSELEAFIGQSKVGLNKNEFRSLARIQFPINYQSGQVVKQQPDSIINLERDATTGEMYISRKDLYTYNTNGDIIQFCEYFGKNYQPNNGIRLDYIYDLNGYLTQEFNYNQDKSSGEWVNYGMNMNTYDSKGYLSQINHYSKDQITNQWVIHSRKDKTYDSVGHEIQFITSYIDTEKVPVEWVFEQKYGSTYDSFGNQTQNIYYSWDIDLKKWNYFGVFNYKYDTNGKLIQYIHSFTQSESHPVEESLKIEFNYDSNGNETLRIAYNKIGTDWISFDKTESSYDSNGKLNQEINYGWDQTNNNWVYPGKYEYIYDSNGNLKQLNAYNSLLLITKQTNWYYSKNTGNANILSNELSVYPNPASEYIIFNIDKSDQQTPVEIFDVQGTKVISQFLPLNRQLQISQLKSGMYFYRIQQNNKTYKGKVMVK